MLLCASILLAGCGFGERPNVLLIVIDTARADRFSFNGYERDTSPAIAALAEEGAVYENAYTPAPWTLPAHASLFTGLFPSAHGADAGHLRMDDSHTTLAEAFEGAGYDTVGYIASPWISAAHGFHQGFDNYEEVWRDVGGTERGDMGGRLIASRVKRYLDWRADNPDIAIRPFFMFINYFEPHLPYNPPEPERRRFVQAPIDEAALDRLRRLKFPKEIPFILGYEQLDPDDVRMLSNLYDGEIAYVDGRIGEIVGMLRRHGILDDTIVVITSDHGEMIGEHDLLDHKLNVHEPLLRIPLVLRYPPAVQAAQRIREPVMLQDLFPTLLGMTHVPVDAPAGGDDPEALPLPGVDGLDRPAAGRAPGPGVSGDGPLIAEYASPLQFLEVIEEIYPGADITRWDRALVAWRSGPEKLHWRSDGSHSLYDLSRDPGETNDLAAERPDRVGELTAEVEAWLRRPAARPPLALE